MCVRVCLCECASRERERDQRLIQCWFPGDFLCWCNEAGVDLKKKHWKWIKGETELKTRMMCVTLVATWRLAGHGETGRMKVPLRRGKGSTFTLTFLPALRTCCPPLAALVSGSNDAPRELWDVLLLFLLLLLLLTGSAAAGTLGIWRENEIDSELEVLQWTSTVTSPSTWIYIKRSTENTQISENFNGLFTLCNPFPLGKMFGIRSKRALQSPEKGLEINRFWLDVLAGETRLKWDLIHCCVSKVTTPQNLSLFLWFTTLPVKDLAMSWEHSRNFTPVNL